MAYSCLKRASKGQGGKRGSVLPTGAMSLFGPPAGRCEVMYTANGGKMEEEEGLGRIGTSPYAVCSKAAICYIVERYLINSS